MRDPPMSQATQAAKLESKARGLSVTTILYRSDHGHRFASPMRSFLRLTTDDGAPSVLGILIGIVAPAIVVLTIIAVAIARY